MGATVAPRHRIGYIDGFRAVAVLLVVAYHAAQHSSLHPGPWLLLFQNGKAGVELFFVLSGFCLSYPTLMKLRFEESAAFNVVRYAAHRIVRIVPPYWISIAFFIVFYYLANRIGLIVAQEAVTSGYSLKNVILQALFIPHPMIFNAPYWTLPIEFRWYFIFPLMLLVWVRSPRAFIPIAGSSILIAWLVGLTFDVTFLAAFLFGIVAADIRVRGITFGAWLIPATLFLVVCAGFRGMLPPWGWAYNPLWFVAMFAVVVCAGQFERFERLLSTRWLTAIGLASYSIYLIHSPIISALIALHVSRVLAACASVLMGFAFWAVAERPFVQGAVRRRLIEEFERVFREWLSRLHVSQSIRLSQQSARASVKIEGPIIPSKMRGELS